jgi:esterase/lipase superfamily enzyme
MFLINTRKRNDDDTFSHDRMPKGAYVVYEITTSSNGEEAEEKTLADIPVDDDALLLVHGFNNDFDQVTAAYLEFEKTISKLGFAGNVIGFTWPSYGEWFQYFGDVGQVEYAAFGFLNFLLAYRPLLAGRKLHLNAHSMGAHLVFEALASYSAVDAIPAMGPGNILVDQLTLFAADVRGAALEKNEDGWRAAGEARRLTSYFSANDQVLGISEIANHASRLGLEGAAHPARVPGNAFQVNCTTLIYDHAGYRDKPEVMKDLVAVFAGKASDQISGRRKEDDRNTFAIGPEEEENDDAEVT